MRTFNAATAGVVGLGIWFAAAGPAAAAVITPTGVLTTSEWTASSGGSNEQMINGSGLSGSGSVQNQTHDNEASAGTMWHAGPFDGGLGGPTGNPPAVATQAIVFDLGGLHDLSAAYVWNHNQSGLTSRGVRGYTILVSPTAGGNDFVAVGGSRELAQALGAAESAQTVSFSAPNVRRVMFDIDSAWSGAASDYVGLSEVRFEGTPVPEPAAAGLLAASAALGLRRRRK